MSVIGEPDGAPGGGPQRAGVPVADIITGMYATIAICAAVAHRAETVLGQHTEEILRGLLKKTDVEIATLKADGTV